MELVVPATRRRSRRWIWPILLLLIVAGAGVGLYARGTATRSGGTIAAEDLEVRLGKAEVADIQVVVDEVGAIEPLVKVNVKSTLSGRVTELLVREGQRVARGAVMARVEPDVNQAQTLSAVRSDLRLAELRAADAERDLATNRRLHEEGYLSERQLADFRLRYDTAIEEREAARARSRIVVESGVPLDAEISTTQRVNIVSPMNGIVLLRNVEVGQTVTSGVSSFNEGTTLYTVADLQSMRVEASINEVDIGRVRTGLPVSITVDAFPYRRFAGSVTHISPAARLADKVKVFDIEVTLDEQHPDFRAGMTANIEVRGDSVAQALAVPVEGVFKKDDHDVVYVVKTPFAVPAAGERKPRKTKSGKYDVSEVWSRFFEEREVSVGLASLERAQILSGLTAGTEIALEDPTRPRQIEEE